MDQNKTNLPWYLNPPKALGNLVGLKIKMIGAMVHGFGTFLFWVTPQVKHGTNLTIEVLRRTILKVLESKGQFPPVLYLQLDNASDNKSKLLLAFIAYLVRIQMGVFQVIKVSYLVVGHTHEDIDSYFSTISRHFKYVLKQCKTVGAFLEALTKCFVSPDLYPKSIEQINYCYDLSSLQTDFLDPHLNLARFDMDEKTGNKVHHFIFKCNDEGQAVMQYKILRNSVALYPRQYQVSNIFRSEKFGDGQVVSCRPERDFDKRKFWVYSVNFNNPDQTEFQKEFRLPATASIPMLCSGGNEPLPKNFPLEPFCVNFPEKYEMLKGDIANLIGKGRLLPHEVDDW